jgi:hypothetical protein
MLAEPSPKLSSSEDSLPEVETPSEPAEVLEAVPGWLAYASTAAAAKPAAAAAASARLAAAARRRASAMREVAQAPSSCLAA